ncbi:hypothetical protein JCM1841_003962 [Sporobolomyces salmonicolor]
MAIPSGPSQAPIRAASSMGATLGAFFAVLGLALPTFIYFKQKNEVKKREQYAATRPRGGALALSMEGTKT